LPRRLPRHDLRITNTSLGPLNPPEIDRLGCPPIRLSSLLTKLHCLRALVCEAARQGRLCTLKAGRAALLAFIRLGRPEGTRLGITGSRGVCVSRLGVNGRHSLVSHSAFLSRGPALGQQRTYAAVKKARVQLYPLASHSSSSTPHHWSSD
jgi:hypothetical protein